MIFLDLKRFITLYCMMKFERVSLASVMVMSSDDER